MEIGNFPNEAEIHAMKTIMDGGKGVKSKDLESGMRKINARNLYEMIIWGLRTGIIRDKPRKDVDMNMFNNPKYGEGYPQWFYLLNQLATGNRIDMPKTRVEYFTKFINEKFHLNGSKAQLIRFALAVVNPIEPPKSLKGHWTNWTKSRTALMRIPQVHTGSNIDPKATISKKSELRAMLKLFGIDASKVRVTGPRTGSISRSIWNKPPDTLWRILEMVRDRRDAEIRRLHPLANRHPQNADQAKQVRLATKQLAVVNAAWNRVKLLFARKGFHIES